MLPRMQRNPMNRAITVRPTAILLMACLPGLPHLLADEKPSEPKLVKHQITGLFCPEREKDFEDLCKRKLARFKLVSIDYENAEATFDYDPANEFPGANAEQVIERFDNEVRNASRHTFGAKALRTTPKEKLKLV